MQRKKKQQLRVEMKKKKEKNTNTHTYTSTAHDVRNKLVFSMESYVACSLFVNNFDSYLTEGSVIIMNFFILYAFHLPTDANVNCPDFCSFILHTNCKPNKNYFNLGKADGFLVMIKLMYLAL